MWKLLQVKFYNGGKMSTHPKKTIIGSCPFGEYVNKLLEKYDPKLMSSDLEEFKSVILNVEQPLDECIQLQCVMNNPRHIQFLQNPSERIQAEAIRQRGTYIRYIKNPSKAIQVKAIKSDSDAIQYIQNPTKNIQLLSVRDRGRNIKWIENPSEEVQLAAVEQNPGSIRFIKNPTEKVKNRVRQLDSEVYFKYVENSLN